MEEFAEEGDKTSLSLRLDTFGHLSANGTQKRYVVVYTAAGKRPIAAVIDTMNLPFPFVARDRTFWGTTSRAAEAHYLAAFLNSDYAAEKIEAWINRGLFGLRDINKRILDVPWPLYDKTQPQHVELAGVASDLGREATKHLKSLPVKSAGTQRRWMREQLSAGKMNAANRLVRKISKA